jgi:hypothetical protein
VGALSTAWEAVVSLRPISAMNIPRRPVPAEPVLRSHTVSGIHSKSAPLSLVNHASALQPMAQPQQFIPGHQQLQALRWQGLVQGPGMPNTLQSGQLFSSIGPPVPPPASTSQSISSIPSMGAQTTGSNSSAGVIAER